MSTPMFLTFNTGSSTVKLGLFEAGADGARRLAKGVVDFRDEPLEFRLDMGDRRVAVELAGADPGQPPGILAQVLDALGSDFDLDRLMQVAKPVRARPQRLP